MGRSRFAIGNQSVMLFAIEKKYLVCDIGNLGNVAYDTHQKYVRR